MTTDSADSETGVAQDGDGTVSQQEAVEYFQKHAGDAAKVGGYVRVTEVSTRDKSCFGPQQHDGIQLGWRVVEIDWIDPSFLMAPMGDLE